MMIGFEKRAIWRLKRIEGGEVFGPVTQEEIKNWADGGQVSPGDLVDRSDEVWKEAVSLDFLKMEWQAQFSPPEFSPPVTLSALKLYLEEKILQEESLVRHVNRPEARKLCEVIKDPEGKKKPESGVAHNLKVMEGKCAEDLKTNKETQLIKKVGEEPKETKKVKEAGLGDKKKNEGDEKCLKEDDGKKLEHPELFAEVLLKKEGENVEKPSKEIVGEDKEANKEIVEKKLDQVSKLEKKAVAAPVTKQPKNEISLPLEKKEELPPSPPKLTAKEKPVSEDAFPLPLKVPIPRASSPVSYAPNDFHMDRGKDPYVRKLEKDLEAKIKENIDLLQRYRKLNQQFIELSSAERGENLGSIPSS